MSTKARLYFPLDRMQTRNPDLDLGADYLELKAFFFHDVGVLINDDLNNHLSISDFGTQDIDIQDAIISPIVERVSGRQRALGDSYPFELQQNGNVLVYRGGGHTGKKLSNAQSAYMISLVLSNLNSMSPILKESGLTPDKSKIDDLRKFFQYFATAALAAEVNGRAWSFGFPRPDGSGFWNKLNEAWSVIKDGIPCKAAGVQNGAKDDQVDVIAVKMHPDNLPGFLFAVAQVATGKDWDNKGIRDYFHNVFERKWFAGRGPVSSVLVYHIIPFARPDDQLCWDCARLGNILHRLRVPYLVAEAERRVCAHKEIEAFSLLPGATEWIECYSGWGAKQLRA